MTKNDAGARDTAAGGRHWHPSRRSRKFIAMGLPRLMPKVFLWAVMSVALVLPSDAKKVSVPADLGPMLEHAAIVEEMMRACGHARPDLRNDLNEAWQAWLRRNKRVNQALETAKQRAGTPLGDTVLYLLHALQTALEDQTKTLEATNNAQYAARCGAVSADIRSGHLDYRTEGAK